MSDGWNDGNNCTIINFHVYFPQGIMFFKLFDVSDRFKDENLLFEILDEMISVIEEHNAL